MKPLLCLLAAAALLTGCVTTPQAPQAPTSRVFNAPKESVWSLLVSDIAPLYPVKVIEKNSGLITTGCFFASRI